MSNAAPVIGYSYPSETNNVPAPPEAIGQLEPAPQIRAREVWHAAFRFRQAIEDCRTWKLELRAKGNADPGLLMRLHGVALTSLQVLRAHRPNLLTVVMEESDDAIMGWLPPIPDPSLTALHLDEDGQIHERKITPWWEDRAYHACVWDHRRRGRLGELEGELLGLLAMLKTYPLTAMQEQSGQTVSPHTYENGAPNEAMPAMQEEVAVPLQSVDVKPRADRPVIALIDGGFTLDGTTHDLTGRPFQVLKELHDADHYRLSRDRIRTKINVDDEAVDNPDAVVRDAVKTLKAALRNAARQLWPLWEPITSTGKGEYLTYTLNI